MWSLIKIALTALGRNGMRTALTTMGIAIGIAAVIGTVALGEGSAAQVHKDLVELGDNFVWLENGSVNAGGVRTGAGGAPPRCLFRSSKIESPATAPDVAAQC